MNSVDNKNGAGEKPAVNQSSTMGVKVFAVYLADLEATFPEMDSHWRAGVAATLAGAEVNAMILAHQLLQPKSLSVMGGKVWPAR